MPKDPLRSSPLGQSVSYGTQYDPSLLFPLAREQQRESLSLPQTWFGEDIWHAYELSWLAPSQKPIVAMARFHIPHDSPNLIESKSLKLYLNSLNETVFPNTESLQHCLQKDLSAVAQAPVRVEIFAIEAAPTLLTTGLPGVLIDEAKFTHRHSEPRPEHLRCDPATLKAETLSSHLLKSNCLITNQPDWGSLIIRYRGPKIDRSSLLEYIVSYRNHNEFHEHCVERIFCDVLQQCQPELLFIQALYTRRGGLDINPWRSTHQQTPPTLRTFRQ